MFSAFNKFTLCINKIKPSESSLNQVCLFFSVFYIKRKLLEEGDLGVPFKLGFCNATKREIIIH